jgi:hypothetical protein
MATIEAARTLEQYFVTLRREGVSAELAAQKTLHAYGGGRRPSDIQYRIDRAEAMWAREQAEQVVESEPEVEAPADPRDDAGRELRARIEQLEVQRRRLSLDAGDSEKARREYARAGVELESARAEAQRLVEARLEQAHREQDAETHAKRQAVEAAVHRARELQAGREAAAAKVDRAGLAFAQALAEHAGVSAGQAQALTDAGRPDTWRTVMAPAWVLQAAFAHALLEAGAPVPAELDQMAISRHAPLAALDVHVVERITSTQKEK